MPDIDHVIVLVLENRSFDHMLGFLDHPNPAFGTIGEDGAYANPGWAAGTAAVRASPTAKTVLPIGPDHSHDGVMEQLALDPAGAPTNLGFVRSLERKGRGMLRSEYAGLLGWALNWWKHIAGPKVVPVDGLGSLAMLCQPPDQVPVLSRLALDFAVCTRWFSSVPGETWPNRNFLHAATSDGETDIEIRMYDNPTIFELLEANGKPWHIYYDNTPQVWAFRKLWDTPERHANWYPFDDFFSHIAAGQLPAYSFIEPNHRPPIQVSDDAGGGDAPGLSDNQHPENNLVSVSAYESSPNAGAGDFRRAEGLIAAVYEALRSNPVLFERSLLLVTYDEHGGLYDHVAPARDVPSPGTKQDLGTRLLHLLVRRRSARFAFTMLGPRVPAVVISPYVPRGTVDQTTRDHASVPSTLRAIFAPHADPLTRRDAWAQPFHGVASLSAPRRDDLPDLSAWVTPSHAGARPFGDRSVEAANRADAASPGLPESYAPYAAQARRVHRELAKLGEPEATVPLQSSTPQDRAAETAGIFAAAAARHRGEQPELAR
jgi:phospholipase C